MAQAQDGPSRGIRRQYPFISGVRQRLPRRPEARKPLGHHLPAVGPRSCLAAGGVRPGTHGSPKGAIVGSRGRKPPSEGRKAPAGPGAPGGNTGIAPHAKATPPATARAVPVPGWQARAVRPGPDVRRDARPNHHRGPPGRRRRARGLWCVVRPVSGGSRPRLPAERPPEGTPSGLRGFPDLVPPLRPTPAAAAAGRRVRGASAGK